MSSLKELVRRVKMQRLSSGNATCTFMVLPRRFELLEHDYLEREKESGQNLYEQEHEMMEHM